ncbi:MAG TPA: patatin-like phospholipase family protein [Solirubrobacteraceae bacterium]|jgi:predicted acylesterase/phospholipase RssA
MGKVVKLEPSAKGRRKETTGARSAGRGQAATPSTRTRARTGSSARRKPEKTALVLGGGGFTGGVYEIGALRALDLLAPNGALDSFDVYVGTSAGAFIAALRAGGVGSEEMMRVISGEGEGEPPFSEIGLRELLRLDLGALARRGVLMPLHILSLARRLATQRGEASLMDLLLGFAEGLPAGLYSGAGIERYLHKVLSEREIGDDFRKCASELYIVATDLDTSERVVFGSEGLDDVPISKAARASGALPMVYAPVKIGERELIDGGILSTTNIDLAVQAGAQLIVVVNPLVPFVNDFNTPLRTMHGVRSRRVSDMGFAKIGYQAFKLLAYRGLHSVAEGWEKRYPDVDIVLIEPDSADEVMFETSIMSFTSRVEIAKHGFESVARQLAKQQERYAEVFARHGLEISPERLSAAIEHFDSEVGAGHGWRRLLESTTGALLRQSGAAG